MKWRPQYRLRMLFLLVFCAAVGLAAKGLMYPIYTAMIVGLAQQIGELRIRRDLPAINESSLSFAINFAISWRFLLAALLLVCVILRMLLVQNELSEPNRKELLFTPPDYDIVGQLCGIVVLSNSIARWQTARLASQRQRLPTILAWIAGGIFAAIILPDAAMVHYLVHIATQNVENTIPAAFQRSGVFSDQRAEGFRVFWLSVCAAVSIVMAALTLTSLSRDPPFNNKRRWIAAVSFLVLLSVPCAFCVWYFGREFSRISPDLASVRFAGNWSDWLGAVALVAVLITIQAYRLARSEQPRLLTIENQNDGRDPPFHESSLVLLYVAGAAAYTLLALARALYDLRWTYGISSFGEAIVSFLQYSPFYLSIALSIISLQLCWARWRRRPLATKWELAALSRRRFFGFWFALVLLAVVGIPTISAYCFAFWLGPWYLLR